MQVFPKVSRYYHAAAFFGTLSGSGLLHLYKVHKFNLSTIQHLYCVENFFEKLLLFTLKCVTI